MAFTFLPPDPFPFFFSCSHVGAHFLYMMLCSSLVPLESFLVSSLTPSCPGGTISFPLKKKPVVTFNSCRLSIYWGSDCKFFLHFHVTLILSTLDYNYHIYSSASISLLAHLDTVVQCGNALPLFPG